MAVRGAESKEKITAKILEIFPGAFQYQKEIRIPIMENGEIIQIKCVLTCAKTNVENGGDSALPGEQKVVASSINNEVNTSTTSNIMNEPTPEEKKNVEDLLHSLGLV